MRYGTGVAIGTMAIGGMGIAATLLWRGMRSVLEVGGTCGEGGPFVVRQACPDGVVASVPLACLGAVVCVLVYLVAAREFGGTSLLRLGWPVLFLSLGWNFLEDAIEPASGARVGVSSLICGVFFVVMGGVPLIWGVVISRRHESGVPDAVIPMAEQRQQRARLAEIDRLGRSGVIDADEQLRRRAAIPLARFERDIVVRMTRGVRALLGTAFIAGVAGGWVLFSFMT